MTYYVTALTNTPSRLIVSESRTDDYVIADSIAYAYEARGHIVVRREEG